MDRRLFAELLAAVLGAVFGWRQVLGTAQQSTLETAAASAHDLMLVADVDSSGFTLVIAIERWTGDRWVEVARRVVEPGTDGLVELGPIDCALW